MKIVMYDLETTGLDINRDKIIEGYFLDIVDKTYLHLLCDPGVAIPCEVSKINGWTNMDLKGKGFFQDKISSLLEFCSDKCIFIAHNNDYFDKLMLLSNLYQHGVRRPKTWKFIDTCKLARIAYPDLENYKQETLQRKFKIQINNNHKANKDVLDLIKIYENICTDLKLHPVDDVLHIWKLSRNWIPEKMMFGKHKGMLIKDLPESYKQWLRLNQTHNRELIKALG